MNKYNSPTFGTLLLSRKAISKAVVHDLLEEDSWKLNFVEDLVSERDFGDDSNIMSTEEINGIIEFITTSWLKFKVLVNYPFKVIICHKNALYSATQKQLFQP